MLCQKQYNVFIFTGKIKEANTFWAANFVSEKNPAFLSFNKRDCHAQLHLGLHDIKDIQNFCTGMKFKLPWALLHEKLYDWRLLVAFFMGDTPAYDKLCCLQNPNSACRMCNINEKNLMIQLHHTACMTCVH